MVSDNASTFKLTAVKLKVLFDHPEVQSYLQKNFLTWRFNLSLAAWWGGFFKRMVGMMKQILRKILGNARPTFEEMEVVLKKTQEILNNRPLTYQGKELEEEAITPNHLIFGHILPQLPDIPDDILEEEDDVTRLKYVEQKLNHVWSRWSDEYLMGLRKFHKNKVSKSGKQYISDQETWFLIANKGVHRGMWKKAKVLKLIRGLDSVARGVALEAIVNGSKRRLERTVQQVYPLELRCQEENIRDDKFIAPDRPSRQTKRGEAALNAKAKISTLAEDINQTDID